MKHRTLGRTGLSVSEIGLGTEHLIYTSRQNVSDVIRKAVDGGINYFDCFLAEEEVRENLGNAFSGLRDKVHLAAHLGANHVDGQYEKTRDLPLCEILFHDFLKRYKTDYVDVVFVHNCDGDNDYNLAMGPSSVLDLAQRFQKEGKARAIGFSSHNIETSTRAICSGSIDVLMFPVNLTNHVMPGRQKLFELCTEKEIGLIAMKPFAGGNLVRNDNRFELENYQMGGMSLLGEKVEFTKSRTITPVQCLSYVLDQPGLSSIVPGCASLDEMNASLAYLEASDEAKNYSSILPDFEQYNTGICVHCNHCLPCPAEINIGETLRLMQLALQALKPPVRDADSSRVEVASTASDSHAQGIPDETRRAYHALEQNASDCIQCGECIPRCPFGVFVISQMESTVKLFDRLPDSLPYQKS